MRKTAHTLEERKMRKPGLTGLGDLFAAIDRLMLEEGRTEEEVVVHTRQYIAKLKTWALEN